MVIQWPPFGNSFLIGFQARPDGNPTDNKSIAIAHAWHISWHKSGTFY